MESKTIHGTNNDSTKVEYDITMFSASSSKGVAKSVTRDGAMSIINAKTGKRISLPTRILEKIEVDENIQFSLGDGVIAIGNNLPNNTNYFGVKLGKSKGNIYSAGLVEEITTLYSLDFSDKTSITFSDVDFIEGEDATIAVIKID